MTTFNLPDLGEGLAEAEIVRWHVNVGDAIAVDQPMLAVETAKAVVEVPAPFSGVIKKLHGQPGDVIATGSLLVEFEGVKGSRATDAGTVVGNMPPATSSSSNPPTRVAPHTAARTETATPR